MKKKKKSAIFSWVLMKQITNYILGGNFMNLYVIDVKDKDGNVIAHKVSTKVPNDAVLSDEDKKKAEEASKKGKKIRNGVLIGLGAGAAALFGVSVISKKNSSESDAAKAIEDKGDDNNPDPNVEVMDF